MREGRVQEGIGRVSGAFPRETRAEPDRALGPAGSGFPSRARRAAARETRRGIRARSAARFAGAIRTLAETQEAVAVAAILCALTRTTGVRADENASASARRAWISSRSRAGVLHREINSKNRLEQSARALSTCDSLPNFFSARRSCRRSNLGATPICAGRRRRAETTTGTSNGWRSDNADATARYRYETHVRASEDACDPTTESRRLAPRMR